MKLLAGIALLAAAGAATAQQAPAPASDQAPPRPATTQNAPPAQKPLDLRLNDAERRPAVSFAPKENKKDDPAKDLPGLGGNPSEFLNHPSDSSSGPIIPRTDSYF